MDGEQKMNVGMCVEVAVNLLQIVILIGFLYLFFDKGDNKVKNFVTTFTVIFVMFTVANYFTFNGMTLNHIDSVIMTTIMVLYSAYLFTNPLYLKIIIPVIAMGLNIVVSSLNLYIMVSLADKSFFDALTFSTSFRYLFIITANLVYAVIMFVVLRIGKQKISISRLPEIVMFILISVVIYAASLSCMVLYELTGPNEKFLPYIVMICVSVFALTGIFLYLILKLSRESKLKTELLLSTQREELYKNSVLSTNEQIEKISHIKHDIKNNIMTLSQLLSCKEYDSAKALCDEVSCELIVPALCHSTNPVLNAIVNVETEKAHRNNITFTLEINDSLSFVDDSDIVSIVGNLCDNAIEYLCTVKEEKRIMKLTISAYRGYHHITCKNYIASSVLKNNPDMSSTKEDTDLCGNGMKILKKIAAAYSGEILIKEYDNELSISAIIRNKK